VQELWLAYRRENCLYYREGKGTISRIQASECVRSMTADRAEEFRMLGPK
jgi:uncharacterized protein YecT (DUF1311 family)